MIQEAHIDGLSHREIVFASLIATYKTKNRTQQQGLAYKDLLLESDAALIVKLGAILKLAIAMDVSETQPIQSCHQYPAYETTMTSQAAYVCTTLIWSSRNLTQ